MSEAHARLGEELRRLRRGAGRTVRDFGPYSPGHLSNVENGHAMPSRDLVEHYLRNGAGDRFQVYSLFEAARRAGEDARTKSGRSEDAGQVAEPTHRSDPEIRRMYYVDSTDSRYFFDDRRVVEELRVIVAIRALVPDVEIYNRVHSYPSDMRRGVLAVECEAGCAVDDIEESDTGSLRLRLRLDRKVQPAEPEPYVFSYRVYISSKEPAHPVLMFQTASGKVARCSISAQFSESALPAPIWWFASPTRYQIEHPVPSNVMKSDSRNFYFKDFANPAPSWCYGLAWLW